MALVSTLGLGTILLASDIIFTIITWFGIAYLVYIGIRLILVPHSTTKTKRNTNEKTLTKSRSSLFREGSFIAIGNPKGIIFFTALFPQFINASSASIHEFLIIFITLGVVTFGCYMLYATFGVKLNSLFQARSFEKK